MSKRSVTWMVLIGVLFLAVSGALAIRHARQSENAASIVMRDATASVPRVVALGRIEPISEVMRIAAPATQDSGRLAEIRVQEGQWIEAGAIIAILDTRPRLLAALQQAEATLALRQAALDKLKADLESQEKTLTAALEQQESQRDRTKWDFDRLQQLQKSGIYRDTALIDKRLALEGANHALDSARLLLERNQRRDASGRRLDELSAHAEVAAAEAALARAKAEAEFSILRAPISGRIIRRMGRVGEQIGTEGLAEIADTRVMMVRAEAFESDLRHIKLGMPVEIRSRALPDPLHGIVQRIGLKVNRQTIIGEDPAANLDARVIEVMIRLDDASSGAAGSLTGLQVRAYFDVMAGS